MGWILWSRAFNSQCSRFDLSLESRLEYLTLAVGNAKSHPVSVGSKHETAIAFLQDLEEKLEVAQVQLELYNALHPHIEDPDSLGDRIKLLSKKLMTVTEVSFIYIVLISCRLNCAMHSCTKNMQSHLTSPQSNCSFCMFLNIATRISFDRYGMRSLRKVSIQSVTQSRDVSDLLSSNRRC